MIDEKKYKGFQIIIMNVKDGIQLESANLGNDKKMLIATDLHFRHEKNRYAQKAYGPYNKDDLSPTEFDLVVAMLQNNLLTTRKSRQDFSKVEN